MSGTSESFSRIQNIFFFLVLSAATIAFLWLIQPFLFSILWAFVLGILFYPVYARLTRTFGGIRPAAALTTVVLAVIAVLLPLSVVGSIVTREVLSLYLSLSGGDAANYFARLQDLPLVQWLLLEAGITPERVQTSLLSFLQSAGGSFATGALGAGAHIASGAAKLLIMLYVLFVFFKDGKEIGARIMSVLPLGDVRELFLFEKFRTTTLAIVKGSLLVALAQGLVGTLLFTLVGIPNPVLWGSLMSLCAIIPAVGPALIWAPAAIFLFLFGQTSEAIMVVVGGLLFISTLDNILRPVLVGRETQMPDVLVLLSVLGGISLFGISGVILGPVLASLFLALWQLFEKEYRNELVERG